MVSFTVTISLSTITHPGHCNKVASNIIVSNCTPLGLFFHSEHFLQVTGGRICFVWQIYSKLPKKEKEKEKKSKKKSLGAVVRMYTGKFAMTPNSDALAQSSVCALKTTWMKITLLYLVLVQLDKSNVPQEWFTINIISFC